MDHIYSKMPKRKYHKTSVQTNGSSCVSYKCHSKVRTKFTPTSRTNLIMGLLPPPDSDSNSSEEEEEIILKRHSKPRTYSKNETVTLPTDDICTTLSDIELDIIQPEQTYEYQTENMFTYFDADENILENNSFSNIISNIEIENSPSIASILDSNHLFMYDIDSGDNKIQAGLSSNASGQTSSPIPTTSQNIESTITRPTDLICSVSPINRYQSLESVTSGNSKSTNNSLVSTRSKTVNKISKPLVKTTKPKQIVKKKTTQIKQTNKIRDYSSFQWKREEFYYCVTEVESEPVGHSSIPNVTIRKPSQYFSDCFSNDIWDIILHETIRYSAGIRNNPLDLKKSDLQNFIGMELAMGIKKLPSYTDYWSNDCRDDLIASVMPLRKYQLIRRFIHFVDNNTQNDDRYYKIRPILDIVRRNFLSIKEEGKFSIDEMMVPYKGTRAGSRRQYLPKKPTKWGFKIFVRSGISGLIHDFIPYGGEDTFRNYTFTDVEKNLGVGGQVVIALCSTIKDKSCSYLYMDNFFTSLELMILLREKYGILSLGTIRRDRLRGCPLSEDKILMKKGRGSYDMVASNAKKICVVKWQDNKNVCLASTYCEVQPLSSVKRIEKKKAIEIQQGQPRSKVEVPCPDIVKKYNAFMGGVDLSNMLISLYRTPFRSHRWYLAIFSQVLDMCVCNAWLVYRKDCEKAGVNSIALKRFRMSIANVLMQKGKKYSVNQPQTLPGNKRPRKIIDEEIPYDCKDHFPEPCEKGRCSFCKGGQTRMRCIKCQARLCIIKERNCFYDYHHK